MSTDEHARVPLPPPLIFLGFLLLALAFQAAMPLPLPAAPRWISILILVAGVGLGGWAVFELIRAHTSPDPGEPTTALVTSGPYAFTRNPIYGAFTLIVLGISLFLGNWWGLLLTPALVLLVTRVVVRAEETYLAKRFGEQYKTYTARVGRWI